MKQSSRIVISVSVSIATTMGAVLLWVASHGGWSDISNTLWTLVAVPFAGFAVIGLAILAVTAVCAASLIVTYVALGPFGSSTETRSLRTTQEVVRCALEEFRSGARVRATCLRCDRRLLAKSVLSKNEANSAIQLSCRCGECSGIYPFHERGA